MHFPRSATTRKRRPGEGDDLYHFLSDEQFDLAIVENRFIEWATVHSMARYGTLIEEVLPFLNQGKVVVREVDVQGFDSIRSHPLFSDGQKRRLLSIFILPENHEQLLTHITSRSPLAQEELTERLKSAEREIVYAERCDARVINREGQIDRAVADVEYIIAQYCGHQG